MALTIKVNGTTLSLAHKGSNHIAKNTPPDVCKTPSPGGPVPIPYPVIISMSSDLQNGTTTVKADGGNMIAIKGSELSRCTGDEPGVAGGVVSNTNMKEAKWILYSFDVKMEGANACRLTDKMTMNHGNTVCLGGVLGIPVSGNLLVIACTDAHNPSTGQPYSECDYLQFCEKIKDTQELARKKKIKRDKRRNKRLEKKKKNAQATHRNRTAAALEPLSMDERRSAMAGEMAHPCAAEEWDGNPRLSGFDPDHTHEVQHGGDEQGPFKWMRDYVNRDIGRELKKLRGGMDIEADCCPR